MAKTKTPFLSLGSQGSVGGSITTQKGRSTTLVRAKPLPTDPRSIFQLHHRHLYRVACQYWNGLTPAEKQEYATRATSYHISGMAYFLKLNLPKFADLLFYYPMDENSGSTIYDHSAHNQSATIFGCAWYPGKFNSALHFDGINDFVALGSPALLDNLHVFTHEFYIYRRGSGVNQAIYDKRYQHITISTTNLIYTYFEAITQAARSFSLAALPLTKWTHVAVTFNDYGDRTPWIYIDGVLSNQAQLPAIGALQDDSAQPIYWGKQVYLGRYPLDADLDEYMLYGVVEPSADILLHANRKEL